jgi:hypothetical protein
MNGLKRAILAATVLSYAGTANAVAIDLTIAKNDAELPGDVNEALIDQSITFAGLNTNPTGGATVTFSARGDLNGVSESILLSVDGFSFGTWLDGDLINDTIAGPDGDIGTQYETILVGQAIIPLVTLTGLLADGELAFLFDYDETVGNLTGGFSDLNFAQVRLLYEAVPGLIPEPATLTILTLGLAALGAARRRRTKRQRNSRPRHAAGQGRPSASSYAPCNQRSRT